MNLDKCLGGLYGVAIGDSLGAPFEFRNSTPKIKYTGILTDKTITVNFQYSKMILYPYSITDDTEMTIQLLKSILDKNGKYDRLHTIQYYLDWANMKNTPLGKNTRNLMKGITKAKNYQKRYDKKHDVNIQSNGTLMRCFPLAMLKYNNKNELENAIIEDCKITNNNIINITCNLLFVRTLRYFLWDESLDDCDWYLKDNDDLKQLSTAMNNAMNNIIVDVSESKGWIIHAFYVAFITLFNTNSFEEGMDYINKNFFGTLSKPSDTDTIMSITGGLLGVAYGFDRMNEETKTKENIKRISEYFSEHSKFNIDRPKLTDELIAKIYDIY